MSAGLVDAKNYHRWNYDWIAPYVHGRVLEIGGGTSKHLAFLHDLEVLSIDLSDGCVKELRTRHSALLKWPFQVGDITDLAIVDRLGPEF